MAITRPSYCRNCLNACPILVDVEDGRAVRVTGDPSNEGYQGYTCTKGRMLPEQHNHEHRLLHSLKRMGDGSFVPIPSEQLLDEVAARLRLLIDEHGPHALASYFGTMSAQVNTITMPMSEAFMNAVGSRMKFNPDTIDQCGKQVAKSLHGVWLAPAQAFDEPDVALVLGMNPLVSHSGCLPMGHPGKWLRRWLDDGLQLIVVDPRRTEFAKRATIHLQPRPGEDAVILAGILRVVLSEQLYDHEFVDEHVAGVAALAEVVAPFTPDYVAQRAGIDPDDLVRAARVFATGTRGCAVAGTGPNMSGSGTLVEYLVLNLNTLCGRYLRAGDRILAPSTVMAPMPAIAQAMPPFPGHDLTDPVPGTELRGSAAGLPVAALPKAMVLDGPDRVRALLSFGGNPALAWPDQLRVVDALRSLDLLVQVDVAMSATAQLSDYVVAARMSLETPAFTLLQDALAHYAAGYVGRVEPFAQHTDAIVEPPPGSDLLEEWEVLYGLAQRLDLELLLTPVLPWSTASPVPMDMRNKPSDDELLDLAARDSRIPLDEVRRHPHGAVFADPPVFVEPPIPGWTERLDVANDLMMGELRSLGTDAHGRSGPPADASLPLRLISRRAPNHCNSSGQVLKPERGRTYNPAHLHPSDLDALGLASGDGVRLRSARGSIDAIVEADPTVRPGVVSMTHAFGGLPGDDDVLRNGAPTARLLGIDDELQPYTGQPYMSNVPVSVTPIAADEGRANG